MTSFARVEKEKYVFNDYIDSAWSTRPNWVNYKVCFTQMVSPVNVVLGGRTLKELQNDTLFSSKLFSTGGVPSKIHFRMILKCRYTSTLSVCICIYNNIRHSLTKRVSFCSSFRALSTDTSLIEIGVCYQKLSTLEFIFPYQLIATA